MKQFIRNFRRQKTIGILNICGLSLGIMASLTVGLWAISELTFDNFHKDVDKMYRVVQNFELNGEPLRAATSFKPLGELIQAETPDIEQMCRIYKETEIGITIHNMVNFGMTSLSTDPNFFTFFSFPLKEGDPVSSFSGTNDAIISESAAKKYFPNEDPIGQKIQFHGYDFSISGIMYDMPQNSHIQADFVFPMFGFIKEWQWNSSFSFDTYFIISNTSAIPTIEIRLTEISKSGISSTLQDSNIRVELEPVLEAHFSKTSAEFENAVKGNKSLLMIFVIIAITILVIACINFTNLFISTSFLRAKTIGIKKSIGAGKMSLILDFYKETAIYVLLSIIVGVILTVVALPVFNSYTHSNITVDFLSVRLYIFLLGLALITILMAGTFPAIQMTRFGVVDTLRSKFRGKKMSVLQNVLIVVQFTSSICLLIVVLFFAKQIHTILSQDLGFDNKNILYVRGWVNFGRDYKSLREEMIQNPAIADVAIRQYHLPMYGGNGIGAKNTETGDMLLLDLSEVSPNYFDFFGMEFIAGENPLILESSRDSRYCVLNERAVEVLGLGSDPIDKTFILVSIGGKLLENNEQPYIVKGVIKDTYVKSLYQDPDAQMYLFYEYTENSPLFFKITGDPQSAIKVIEKRWKELAPNVPFEYHFLDKAYDNLYATEINSRNILTYALIITLLITIAGLYAMVFYSIQRRVKEIGIRKINGATVLDLLRLLNTDIVIWVGISFVIACPLSYVFLQNWLDGFVVRTPLSWWVFFSAGLGAAVIALITVSYQTWKTATANPIDAIKNE